MNRASALPMAITGRTVGDTANEASAAVVAPWNVPVPATTVPVNAMIVGSSADTPPCARSADTPPCVRCTMIVGIALDSPLPCIYIYIYLRKWYHVRVHSDKRISHSRSMTNGMFCVCVVVE